MRYVVLHSKRIDSTFPSGPTVDDQEKTLNERVAHALERGADLIGGISCDTSGNYLQAVLFPED